MKLLKTINNNPFFNAIRNIRELLEVDQKRRSLLMLLLLIINAAFDVLGLSLILPITKIAIQPELVQTNIYVKWVYDFIGLTNIMQFLLVLSLVLLFVFLAKNALSVFILYIQSRFAFNIALRLSKKQFQYYYQQGFLFIKNKESGKKIYDIISIPYYFAGTYIIQTLIFSTELVVVVFILLGLLFYNVMLVFILMIVVVPAFLLIYVLTKNQVKQIGDKRNILFPKSYATVIESMEAFVNVKLSNKEKSYLENFSNLQDKINKLDVLRLGVYQKIPQKSNEIIAGLGIVAIFLFAVLFPEKNASTITILSLFGVAAFRLMPSINRMMSAVLDIKNYSYSVEELRHLKNINLLPFGEFSRMPFKENIEFKAINFNYKTDSNWRLKNISFEIKKGETIGFIGESGSGKTTLIHLFLRLIKETKGVILVDGLPLTSENESSFQRNIGYVQQDVFIKNGSIIENVAFGEPTNKIDLEKAKHAIEKAMLGDFVRDQMEGFDLKLGERGAKLSGGQKQRIGIARALYKEAEILVFDEATSALDMETENSITETINNLASLGKTVLIIAHRITTLNRCDRIYEMKNGEIIKAYSYNQLFEERFSAAG